MEIITMTYFLFVMVYSYWESHPLGEEPFPSIPTQKEFMFVSTEDAHCWNYLEVFDLIFRVFPIIPFVGRYFVKLVY